MRLAKLLEKAAALPMRPQLGEYYADPQAVSSGWGHASMLPYLLPGPYAPKALIAAGMGVAAAGDEHRKRVHAAGEQGFQAGYRNPFISVGGA